MEHEGIEAAVEPVSATAPPLRGRVLMTQRWCDLAYLHWAIRPDRVAHLMPPGVRPDVREGQTYVGLVPFAMRDAGLGRGPGIPWIGSFLETNVRLYSVDSTGRRGVVFLSLDCERLLVVAGARAAFGTPYQWTRMRHHVAGRRPDTSPEGETHTWTAVRRAGMGRVRGPRSRITLQVGDPLTATDLDDFVSARWGLHTQVLGRSLYVPNAHPPWPLHAAELLDLDDEFVAAAGFPELADRAPDHVAFSPGVRTSFGLPVHARRPR